MELSFFATVPKGMESLLADELAAFGADALRKTRAGVEFQGSMALGYRACLWSRIASRVLLSLARFPAASPDELYDGVRSIHWDEHLGPDGSFAVDFNTAESAITHSHFGALKVKDAIVDQFRDAYGRRPSVHLARPEVRINVYLHKDRARLSLDLSGESLHRRAYREEGVPAPLKENLAAAVLTCAGWPELSRSGAPLLDPMCGSGTLPIEAALIAMEIAPGLLRPYFGFMGWRGHDPALWARLLEEARTRRAQPYRPGIVGYDIDRYAVRAAIANVGRAGLSGIVHIERKELGAVRPSGPRAGLMVVNPPYGERLGQDLPLPKLYAALGGTLRRYFGGWRAAVFTGSPELVHRLRVGPRKSFVLFNGAIECKLLTFAVSLKPSAAASDEIPRSPDLGRQARATATGASITTNAEMFANRLRKNLKTLGRWARRSGIDCYRFYDADLPEYAMAIDLYQGVERWAHVQEYEAPATVDADQARARLEAGLAVVPEVLGIPADHVSLRVRRRQRGKAQYESLGHSSRFYAMREGACRYWVNFHDYLDTGLFLDHRLTRSLLFDLAPGKRFLNLFGYTGTATVCAALGGSVGSTTVDLSHTYLDWTRRNLELNQLDDGRHELVQADCLEWLTGEAARAVETYDLIFLDAPTFSNSKRMQQTFDVQRDHVDLIVGSARLLRPGGVLIFSTHRRRFTLGAAALLGLGVQDLTQATIPYDFARHPGIHQCWKLTKPLTE